MKKLLLSFAFVFGVLGSCVMAADGGGAGAPVGGLLDELAKLWVPIKPEARIQRCIDRKANKKEVVS